MASKLQGVLDALATRLAAPLAGTVYEPERAARVNVWPDEETLTKSGQRTIYLVRRGDTSYDLPDSGTDTITAEVFILAAHWVGTSEPQLMQATIRAEVIEDLEADMYQKLRAAEGDPAGKLGGVDGLVTLLAGSVRYNEEDNDIGQWLIPELLTLVRIRKEHGDR